VFLNALRWIVGDNLFSAAIKEYATRWSYRHPTPYDLFNTFEDVIGEDLDWFWTPAFFETWTLDQAITGVEADESAVTVTVRDLGLVPMPVFLTVTYADGSEETGMIGVETWLQEARMATVVFSGGEPVRVEIDRDRHLPDMNRSNNIWSRG
jgi:aminopeptidase N